MIAKILVFLAVGMLAWAQPPQGPTPAHMGGPRPSSANGPGGKWWANPEMIRRLGITPDQQQKMDEILQQSRLRLIDLNAALEKEEVTMEGLVRGPQLDDAKILASIDRVAQARAELEKANARMMLAIRHVLTPEQWEKLNSEGSGPRHSPGGPGGPGGPSPHHVPGGPPGPPPPPPPSREE